MATRRSASSSERVRAALQGDAARGLGVFQLLDAGEMPIDQHGIGERPQMLCRLQLGRVGRQEEQVDMVRHAQALGAVPAGAIQHQHDLLASAEAPTAVANAASSASKRGMLTDVAR